ncbi:MAG: phosphatidylglycerol lysyltransferase domain-containing protein [Candidatus Omnitrophica bacterium]|nr:phosphatidylglycerol lysyltransferase domain-containing protein [Candidatus Omnitrophota bacterium]
MNIKDYPEFKPVGLEDLEAFNQALKQFPPVISELTFTNIYSWRKAYQFEVASLGGFLILRSGPENKKSFFRPIGSGDMKAVMEKILEDTGAGFVRIPEITKKMFENEKKYIIEADPDNFDYLYRTEDLIELPGRKYDGKRNLIKNFKSAYEFHYTEFDDSNIKDCLEFEEFWCTLKNCDSVTGLGNERQAIKEMVDNFSIFKLIAGAIKVKERICAVAIGQRLNQYTLVMHVLKADPNMAGLYQAMNNEFLSRQARGFTYVNMEQDLGLAGLRKAKQSYHPVEMIKKYTLKTGGSPA